ncbi:hypothetical protein Tsubulata_035237 [Turnera subulata]|uniref:Uncharacterized protein n=1 Tax=Turnera subulata TaxID=218843 RepID=A0A9Q0FV75_9ROSI|nr:hypothetical protein Tsubulata_035237 [Turnera subulata]
MLSPRATVSRSIPRAGIVVAARPLKASKAADLVTLKPKTSHEPEGFANTRVENCMPKGFHHTSAPSRYINYHTFGSTLCTTDKRVNEP